jgi:MFS family permease
MEMPSYDSIVADFTAPEDRARAYSLNYLGSNIGLILAPTIGGFLFANHLNLAFLINGIMIALSTLLIYIYIKPDAKKVESENTNGHEANVDGISTFRLLMDRPIVIFFIVLTGLSMLVYSQFGYLIPLNYESLYGADGAKIYGTLVSVNGLVVIIFTPLLTKLLKKWGEVFKIIIGQSLIVVGLALYIVIQGIMPMYYVAIVIFTFGEIINTISTQPYLTKRIPANFRGRINSFYMIFVMLFQSIAQVGVGELFDNYSISFTWGIITIVGVVVVIGYTILRKVDHQAYPDLN